MSGRKQGARLVTEIDTRIGFRLRQIRQNKKISQTKIAELCGISYQQIQKYEGGKNRLSIEKLLLISKSLDIDVQDLLGSANDKEPVCLSKHLDKKLEKLWVEVDSLKQKKLIIGLLETFQEK